MDKCSSCKTKAVHRVTVEHSDAMPTPGRRVITNWCASHIDEVITGMNLRHALGQINGYFVEDI